MKKLVCTLAVFSTIMSAQAQDLLGLSTGNYGGIAGMTANPASIVDSRFKFDINIFGLSNYYTNNFVLLRRDAFINGDLFNNKYNSYDAFKKDFLELNGLSADERVYARINNRIQLPLSFMLTTGKRSAIALNITSRTNVMIDNVDQDFARLAYMRFRNPELYNRDFNMNGTNVALLSWLDVGLTYGRVVMDNDKHFLKAAVTLKYIGATSSGYFKADDLTLRFTDSSTISARTPYASYGHSDKIDEDIFRAGNINALNSVASTAGLDLGVVYEYRGKISRFKYLSPEFETKTRRDKNKYVFRIGASIMDVGRLQFNKGGYNNDFSANFNDYNVNGLSIKSAQDLDTALAGRVAYNNDVKRYSVALPTAFGLQADLHLWRGFYLNASTYQPLNILKADQRMEVTPSYAITPRFETRAFGLYVPVTYNKLDDWNIGATLRLGPLYIGSSNLGTLIVKEKTRTADVHAGLHIPIAFGKKTRVAHFFDRIVTSDDHGSSNTTYNNGGTIIHSDNKDEEIRLLRQRLEDLENRQRSTGPTVERNPAQPIYITVNNYGSGVTSTVSADTLRATSVGMSGEIETLRKQLYTAQDEITRLKAAQQPGDSTYYQRELKQKNEQIELLMRRIAEKEVQQKDMDAHMKLLEEQSGDAKKKLKSEDSAMSGYRMNSNRGSAPAASNERIEAEMARLRTELHNYEARSTNATTTREKIVMQPAAAIPVIAGNQAPRQSSPAPVAMRVVHDTLVRYVYDTVRVKGDTVRLTNTVNSTQEKLVVIKLERVLFDVGKSNVKPVYAKDLDRVAKQLNERRNLKIKLSGHTDKTGQATANQRLSEARANAVKDYLLKKNVSAQQISIEYFGANEPIEANTTASGKLMNRRVELSFLQ